MHQELFIFHDCLVTVAIKAEFSSWRSKEKINILINLFSSLAGQGQNTALHLSAFHGHWDFSVLLLKHKADVNARNGVRCVLWCQIQGFFSWDLSLYRFSPHSELKKSKELNSFLSFNFFFHSDIKFSSSLHPNTTFRIDFSLFSQINPPPP
jgi:hypothetical protein